MTLNIKLHLEDGMKDTPGQVLSPLLPKTSEAASWCVRMLVRDAVPASLHCIFPFERFNAMQMQVFQQTYHTDQNMIVAAPTGSGKTVALELALARLILSHQGRQPFRCVYIAPSKALCQQRWTEWKIKLDPLGLQVLEVTGDVEWKEVLKIIASAAIIVTTPEKWDALTRMWRDNVFLLGLIDLLLLDEIHHLGEDRGAILEVVIVRMRMINKHCCSLMASDAQRKMRIVALSATLPNIKDVGMWLGCSENAIHYFDDRYRPVPLRVMCFGYDNKGNQFLFEKGLDRYVKDLILKYDDGKQTIVFCASKKGSQSCAAFLKANLANGRVINITDQVVAYSCNQLQDQELAKLLPFGLAYHHAGLPPDDRMIIEQLFVQGKIRVLCATSTLSQGMNLPAHLVIVKGTVAWRGSSKGYVKLKKSDVIQMLGRAGRPGFDDEGIAIIMTSVSEQQYYSSVALHADIVNSTLKLIFHEALVAEISQGVITSRDSCMDWIRSTYFYRRLLYDPQEGLIGQEAVDNFVRDLYTRVLKELLEAKLILIDMEGLIFPLAEAHIMSKTLIKFNSMCILMQLPANNSLQQLLHSFSLCEELHKPVKRTDKKVLNDLMKFIRFPVRERVQEPRHKCYVLLQATISFLPDIKDFTLRIEQAEIVENALRLLYGLKDLSIHKRAGTLLESSLLLERALKTRLWETGSSSPFLQCTGLSEKTRHTLQESGIFAVTDIFGSKLAQVVSRLGCTDVEARLLIQFAASVQCCKLSASIECANENNVKLVINLVEKEKRVIAMQAMSFHLLCYDVHTSRLLFYRYLPAGFEGDEYYFDKYPQDSLRVRILGSLVGADFTCGAAIPSLVPESQRKVRTSNVEITRKAVAKVDQPPLSAFVHDAPATDAPHSTTPFPLIARNIETYASAPLPNQSHSPEKEKLHKTAGQHANIFEEYICQQDKGKGNQTSLAKLSEGIEKVSLPSSVVQRREYYGAGASQSQLSPQPLNVSFINAELGEIKRLAASTFVPSLNVARLKPDILKRSNIHKDVSGRSSGSSPFAVEFSQKQSIPAISGQVSQAVRVPMSDQLNEVPQKATLLRNTKRTFFDICGDFDANDHSVTENYNPNTIPSFPCSTEEEASRLLLHYGRLTSEAADKRPSSSSRNFAPKKVPASDSNNRLQQQFPAEPSPSASAAKFPIVISAHGPKAELSPQSVFVKRPRPVGPQHAPVAAMSQKLLQDFSDAFC